MTSSERRDTAAAHALLRSAEAATAVAPERVVTDGHGSYLRAIRTESGRRVRHRSGAHRNDRLEQAYRGLEGRHRPTRRFERPRSAARFRRAHNGSRDFSRPRARCNRHVPAARRRALLLDRTTAALAILENA